MNNEPKVIINGKHLTDAQAMVIRVAVNDFLMSLEHDDLGGDEHGTAMVKLYRDRLREIQDIIFSA